MSRVVVDASIALSWAFPDEHDPYAQSILATLASKTLLVPAHWILEVVNGILSAERKGRLTQADTTKILGFIDGLPKQLDEQTAAVAGTVSLSLARQFMLSLYDAAYLELCLRETAPLASLDTALVAACLAAGGKLA